MHIPAIKQAAAAEGFRQYLVDLLVEICRLDTTIQPDVPRLRDAEGKVYDVLERELKTYAIPGGAARRAPIDPKIADHPYFSQLYYTRSEKHPEGLSVKDTYAGRCNLLFAADGDGKRNGGVNLAINGHIDVVAPYFPPRVEDGRVFGRGSCDDKGNVVALMGALKLVGEYLKSTGQKLNRHFTGMFVIEEEMGGNGSLSAALDRELKKRYDSLVVLEICENKLFPGNRGCVWYKVEGKLPGVNLFEAAAFIIEQLEKEGRSIRSESDHPLFPHRPVQTCHGMIGHSGEHPSRINGDVSFDISFAGGEPAKARKTIEDVIAFALAEYTGVYGDKTKINDKTTGKPKVDHHFDLAEAPHGFTVRVFGATGHMGSIFENDGAITKMMTMVRSLLRSRAALERKAGAKVRFEHHGWKDPSHLVLEGGQGFLPTHEMTDVQARVRAAAARGADEYFRLLEAHGLQSVGVRGADVLRVTFDKLHNAAFAGRADSAEMRNAIEAAKEAGMWRDEPVRGWDVSCDARIFAGEYPDMNVLTTGPGSLLFAHSDREHIEIDDMRRAAEFLAYYILKHTGTID